MYMVASLVNVILAWIYSVEYITACDGAALCV